MMQVDPLPRPRQKAAAPAQKLKVLVLALGLSLVVDLIVCIAIFGYLYYRQEQRKELLANGVTVNGTALLFTLHHNDSDSTSYSVTYRYSVGGQERQKEEDISQEEFQSLRPGGSILVVYLPRDPSVSILESHLHGTDETASLLWIVGGVEGLLLLIFLGVFLRNVQSFRRSRELEDSGDVTIGEITNCWADKANDEDSPRRTTVAYRFMVPGQMDSFELQQRLPAADSQNYPVGTKVRVRYLPADPRVSRLDL